MEDVICPLCGLPAPIGSDAIEITGRQVHRVCELERRVGDLEGQIDRLAKVFRG